MVAHLTGFESGRAGRPTYVISYGAIRFADRSMGYEDWLREILPTAIRAVSARHDGSDVHLAGWSLGGQLSLLTAAAQPELPIACVVALGAPTDYTFNPAAAPLASPGRHRSPGFNRFATSMMFRFRRLYFAE